MKEVSKEWAGKYRKGNSIGMGRDVKGK